MKVSIFGAGSQDFGKLNVTLKHSLLFDGRNIYEPAEVEAAWLACCGIGRGRSIQQVTG